MGHLAYFLLVLSMFMRDVTRLRAVVIAAALVAIVYDAVWLHDPVGVAWESLLVVVNIVLVTRQWLANRRAAFSEEEAHFVSTRLSGLDRSQARRALNMGLWVDGTEGTVLTTEGHEVTGLVYLVSGRVDIFLGDAPVGTCSAGNFVGEMSVLSGEPASATAVVSAPSRYWMMPAAKLRRLREEEPEIANALELGIAHDLRGKILTANARRSGAT